MLDIFIILRIVSSSMNEMYFHIWEFISHKRESIKSSAEAFLSLVTVHRRNNDSVFRDGEAIWLSCFFCKNLCLKRLKIKVSRIIFCM